MKKYFNILLICTVSFLISFLISFVIIGFIYGDYTCLSNTYYQNHRTGMNDGFSIRLIFLAFFFIFSFGFSGLYLNLKDCANEEKNKEE